MKPAPYAGFFVASMCSDCNDGDIMLQVPRLTCARHDWVELTLRYLVDPKKRRAASSFILAGVFRQIRQRKDIEIGSSTMSLTLENPEALHASEDQSHGQSPRAA
jgi:hypothetical protein